LKLARVEFGWSLARRWRNFAKKHLRLEIAKFLIMEQRLRQGVNAAKEAVARIPASQKETGALICTLISAVAIPVLTYVALLCSVGSRLIEIPAAEKPKAALGAWLAAAMYGATFFYCYNYKTQRREIEDERVPLTGR
jgi:hypothetical protein